MGTTTDKLNKILESKVAIKAAIEAKGVSNVGDILAEYPDKIASIQSGGGTCTGFTGHVDVEGLKAIGWTNEDIEYYQTHGVNWNEEDDEYHKVPQDNIDLYGVLTLDNIKEYKKRIVYLPKLDTSMVTNMDSMFDGCSSLIFVPLFDTSKVTSMRYMFGACYSLISIPLFDTSKVTDMMGMFINCRSLNFVPLFDTSKVTDISNMFYNCYSFNFVPLFDTSKVINMIGMFYNCYSFNFVPLFDTSKVTDIGSMFYNCYSLISVKLKGLKTSFKINNTLLLTKESILYMIKNAAPTSPITITLSAYCYNKYNADEDIVAALTKQPNVSLASA